MFGENENNDGLEGLEGLENLVNSLSSVVSNTQTTQLAQMIYSDCLKQVDINDVDTDSLMKLAKSSVRAADVFSLAVKDKNPMQVFKDLLGGDAGSIGE